MNSHPLRRGLVISAAHHRAILMAARLALRGDVQRARQAVAHMLPGLVVIEINETCVLSADELERRRARSRARASVAPTTQIPYVPLEAEADAWIAEYREARR